MANGNSEPEDKRLVQKDQPKKPYIKPTFRSEKIFVTSALSCGKIQSTEFLCRHNRKAS
jgi:hypothetical protein